MKQVPQLMGKLPESLDLVMGGRRTLKVCVFRDGSRDAC